MSQVLETEQTTNHKLNIGRIVVAVDLSSHSTKTVAYAAAFAKGFGASLTLVHAFPPQYITEFTTPEARESYEEDKRFAQRELRKLAGAVQEIYSNCGFEVRVGDPAEEVILVARDLDADLIITASHHPGFLSRLFRLDAAPRILHRACCPVLVYHEEKELEEIESGTERS